MAGSTAHVPPAMSPGGTNAFHDMDDNPSPDNVLNPFDQNEANTMVKHGQTPNTQQVKTSKRLSDIPSYISSSVESGSDSAKKAKKRQAPVPPKYNIGSVERPETRSRTMQSASAITTVQMPAVHEEERPPTPPPRTPMRDIISGSPHVFAGSHPVDLKEASDSSTETLHANSPPSSGQSSPSKEPLLIDLNEHSDD